MTEHTAFIEQQVKASTSAVPQNKPELTDLELEEANTALADAEPQEILSWAIQRVPRLFQTTAFGLTGLAATDMISKISTQLTPSNEPPKHAVPLIFLTPCTTSPRPSNWRTKCLASMVPTCTPSGLKVPTAALSSNP